MGVALSRDRTAYVTVALGAGAHLFAVAEGFGRIDGMPVAHVAVQRLRLSFERQRRNRRLARALAQPESATALLVATVARLNEEIYARAASHADYVSAGCSLTVVLVVRRVATAVHLGATAAYLERDDRRRALTVPHVVADLPVRLLTRSLGTQARSDAAVASLEIDENETLVLTDSEERRLIVHSFGREAFAVEAIRATVFPFAFLAGLIAAASLALALLCIH